MDKGRRYTIHWMICTSLGDLPDRELREVMPFVSVDGRKPSMAEFRLLCAQAKARGLEVFPPEGCDNFDEKGRCKGHPAGGEPVEEEVSRG